MPCITKLGQILLILTQSFQKLTSFLIDNIHKYISVFLEKLLSHTNEGTCRLGVQYVPNRNFHCLLKYTTDHLITLQIYLCMLSIKNDVSFWKLCVRINRICPSFVIQGMTWIRCGFWIILKIWKYSYTGN
jgi:hypothetical protein